MISDKLEPVPCSSQNIILISHEEITERRKERRKIKIANHRKEKEEENLKKKLNKKSEKIKLITPEELAKYESDANQKLTKFSRIEKFREQYNLLDFIVKRKTQARPIRKIEKKPAIKLNRGKRREIPKKRLTTFKMKIIKSREEKRSKAEKEPSTSFDIEDIINKLESVKLKNNIHSRKFREYCDNITSKELCEHTENLLKELFRYQKRAYDKNEIKATVHKRYVVGFKEVTRYIKVNKVKLVIIAPDCEKCDLPDGIDEVVKNLKTTCREQSIPYLFSLRRFQLGRLLFKKVPVSCVGIISYDGQQDCFKYLMDCLERDRENYKKRLEQ